MSSDVAHVPELRVTLPAHADSLALLRHIVRGFRDPYAIAPAMMDDIVLAVSEAAANAALHAYGEHPGTMTVVARVAGDRLHLLVRDHGCGIELAAQTPAPGHGLSLMTHVSSTLEIIAGPGGTDVLMTFGLVGKPEPSSLTDDFGALS
ncbi:MAG: ATP-binding protein [Solirubrobacteraceae bacterium]